MLTNVMEGRENESGVSKSKQGINSTTQNHNVQAP